MTTKILPSYDPTLFQGAIYYYLQYRPRYPNALYDLISQEFQLDGQGKLLDLGCGIGLVAIALHDQFQSVLGIDPDPEMLEVAKQEAKLAHASNITWVRDLAENISPAIGTFSLVTIGRAFHWMDQELVLQRSYDLLDRTSNANRGIAIIQTEKDIWSHDSVWAQNVLATIKRSLTAVAITLMAILPLLRRKLKQQFSVQNLLVSLLKMYRFLFTWVLRTDEPIGILNHLYLITYLNFVSSI